MKKTNYLVIYFMVIAILLILIMFIIPDEVFLKKYENITLPISTNSTTELEEKEFLDYEIEKDNLKKDKYSFEYNILDSMSTKTYEYKCQGTMEEAKLDGTCSGADSFSFNEDNMDSNFSIDSTYLKLNNILELLVSVEPNLTSENESREYTYNVKIDNLDTEIIVYTDLFDINKIEISNAYMVYVFKYKRVN